MKKYDLHKIMKAAHEIYRKYFKLYQLTHGVQTFGDCLKLAWADEKKRVADEEASGKSSVLLQVGFGSSEMYTNNNLTDEAAERYLAENPKGIVFFASTPSDWEKRVERRMTPALPLDETLVSELVKAFEVEGATSEIVRDAFKTYKLNGKKVTAKVLDAHIKEAQSVVGSKQTTEAVETVE